MLSARDAAGFPPEMHLYSPFDDAKK